MDDFQIHKISDFLESILPNEQKQKLGNYVSLFTVWDSIAGDPLSAHSKIVDIKNNMLIIEVDHPGWIQKLQFIQPSIIKKIKARFPELEIKTLLFRLEKDKTIPGTVQKQSTKQKEILDIKKLKKDEAIEEPKQSTKDLINSVEDEKIKQSMLDLLNSTKK